MLQPRLFLSVDEFEFSARTSNCLSQARINVIGQLVQCSEEDLTGIKSFGRACLKEVKDTLAAYDLSLNMETFCVPRSAVAALRESVDLLERLTKQSITD
jgi:DNA-directed RNA polymerase subunit alpha